MLKTVLSNITSDNTSKISWVKIRKACWGKCNVIVLSVRWLVWKSEARTPSYIHVLNKPFSATHCHNLRKTDDSTARHGFTGVINLATVSLTWTLGDMQFTNQLLLALQLGQPCIFIVLIQYYSIWHCQYLCRRTDSDLQVTSVSYLTQWLKDTNTITL